MPLFKDIRFIKPPSKETSICFSCDSIYFKRYGQYTLQSAIKTHQVAHCHIINPSSDVLDIIDKFKEFNVSFSIENLEISKLHKYQLLSYYFCSRFFVAELLFNNFEIEYLWITDTDVLFDQYIGRPDDKKLCVDYDPNADNLWKKTTGNIIYVNSDKKHFLNLVINEYIKRYNQINFNLIADDADKLTRGNLIGLDQVSMSVVIENNFLNDQEFSGLGIIPNLKGKTRGSVKVWTPVGKSKDNFKEDGFKNVSI